MPYFPSAAFRFRRSKSVNVSSPNLVSSNRLCFSQFHVSLEIFSAGVNRYLEAEGGCSWVTSYDFQELRDHVECVVVFG